MNLVFIHPGKDLFLTTEDFRSAEAQSSGYIVVRYRTGPPLPNYDLENGLVNFKQEKISLSSILTDIHDEWICIDVDNYDSYSWITELMNILYEIDPATLPSVNHEISSFVYDLNKKRDLAVKIEPYIDRIERYRKGEY